MRLTVDQEASTLEMFDNLYMEVYSPYMYMREVQKGLCRKMFIWGTFVGHVQKSMETDIANYQNRYLVRHKTLCGRNCGSQSLAVPSVKQYFGLPGLVIWVFYFSFCGPMRTDTPENNESCQHE